MRTFALFCLALAIPAGAQAGLPGAGLTNGGKPFQQHHDHAVQTVGAPAAGHAHNPGAGTYVQPQQYNHDARCMCPDCQVRRAIEKAEGGTVIIHGDGPLSAAPCAACEASAVAGPIAPFTQGEAPGYASVGGQGAGYAQVAATGEPAPIGVVQTNFARQAPGGMANPANMAFHGGNAPMGMAAGQPAGGPAPVAPWTGMPSSPRRRSVLATMLGIRSPFGAFREAREARANEAHAAIPMGAPAANARVAELPASMVYGR